MGWLFPLLLLAWPVVEIAVLIEIAQWIGWIPAIAAIIASGMAGSWVLRRQGLQTAREVQAEMRRGVTPMAALFDGACLSVAGLLFLLPGFVTDLLALALLVPAVRVLLRRSLMAHLVGEKPSDPPNGSGSGETIIDGEFVVIEENGKNPPDNQTPRLGR